MNDWIFTQEELIKGTPSRSQGISFSKEHFYRSKGVAFIYNCGMTLKVGIN